MSLEYFQVLDNETIDHSLKKRDLFKVCHKQGAQLNQTNQHIGVFSARSITTIKQVMIF